MKKLLLIIIALACMGCDDVTTPLAPGEEGLLPACEQTSSSDWPMKFDESSCSCEWSLLGG